MYWKYHRDIIKFNIVGLMYFGKISLNSRKANLLVYNIVSFNSNLAKNKTILKFLILPSIVVNNVKHFQIYTKQQKFELLR